MPNASNAVEGLANGAGAAIYSQSTFATPHAGHFDGNVTITGQLDVSGAKNFRIDHPLDPARRTLAHAAIETDELQVAYSGNVTTDSTGRATVTLPACVDALATDWRYQLTSTRPRRPRAYAPPRRHRRAGAS